MRSHNSPYLFIFLGVALFMVLGSEASACTFNFSGNTTISASCGITATVEGVDAGTLTINSNASITVGAGKYLVYGSTSTIANSAGSIVLSSGGYILQTNMWQVDADADGYPLNTTIATSSGSPGASYRRYANITSATLDCNDNAYSLTNTCYSYSQSNYYAYGQGNYYGYGENSYYGQSNYYAYGQGNYYGYGQSDYYGESSYYGEGNYYGEGYYYHENFYYEPPAP